MEYERALFRIYDKSMEGLRFPAARRFCWYAEKALIVLSASLFATLWLLHRDFVNKPGCLASLIEEAAMREGVLLPPPSRPPLWVTADGSDPPTADAITVNSTAGLGNLGNETEIDEDDTRVVLPSGASMPYDVMIGISMGGLLKPVRHGKAWGLRGSESTPKAEGRSSGNGAGKGRRAEEDAEDVGEGVSEMVGGGGDETTAVVVDGAGNSSAATNGTGFEADYTFAFEPTVLLLPEKMIAGHSFQWVNFTLEPSDCLRESGMLVRSLAAFVVGYDTIMVNMFMLTARSKGLLRNVQTGAEWWWSLNSSTSSGWIEYAFSVVRFKIAVVLKAFLAFVLMSTVTAMTVRTLLSSGVVLLFPLVMLMERYGLPSIGMQTLALGYPWLGMPIEHLRSRNKPVGPFIMGHIMQMVVFYSVYNACLLAWSMWLYNKPNTASLQVGLYGMMMLWEYFALIFVRARGSIVFFSRTASLSFLAFHVYFYHFRAGYFSIAACSCFAAMFAVKLYVLQSLELPAYISGDITHEQPRANFVELPWSTWDAALPPMWSLFIPPNASVTGVYSDAVPNRPEAGAGEEVGGEEGGRGGGGGVNAEEGASPTPPGGRGSGARAQERGRGRGRGRGVGDADGSRGRGVNGRDGGGDGRDGVEMAARRRRPTRDVEDV